jgi:SAM-dependent methyltransferase
MHPSALELGRLFFQTYCAGKEQCSILDIGAQNVNGSLKDVCPANFNYLGVDFVSGVGVDIVLSDPYRLPFENASQDVVVCSSVFEHSQFFWLLFEEVIRVLKPDGLFYLNAPSNGYVHRYPVDCWRFYPDAAAALAAWARRSGYNPAVMESFIASKMSAGIERDAWNDYVAVFLKDEACASSYPRRISQTYTSFSNGHLYELPDQEVNPRELTDDFELIKSTSRERDGLHAALDECRAQLASVQTDLASTQTDLASTQTDLASTQSNLASLQSCFAEATGALEEIRASRSWRYTAWMRKLGMRIARRHHG